MSVVAAKYINQNTVEIASDSFCTTHSGAKRTDSKKLFKFNYHDSKAQKNREFLLGSSGEFADKWSFVDFISEVKNLRLENRQQLFDLMRRFRNWKREHILEHTGKTVFLIVCRGGIYFYSQDGELTEYTDHVAIGAGANQAVALMHYGATPTQAVETCCDVNKNVAPPVITETLKIN